MKCCIAKDLLPNYIDGLTSEESSTEIRKHLESCEGCRAVYEQMSASLPQEILPERQDIAFLEQLRAKVRRRYVVIALSTCVALAVPAIFAKNYQLPLPFDAGRMGVELHPAVAVANQYGILEWQELGREFTDPPGASSGDDERRDFLYFTCQGMEDVGFTSCARTVNRDGAKVRVVYYCVTKTLWDALFSKEDPYEGNWHVQGGIYDNQIYRANYQPQRTEIYYLESSGLQRLKKLSDQEFDAQKERALLIWSGVA